MKPFDLEKALAGESVVSKEGRKVIQLHYFPNLGSNFKVIAQLEHGFSFDTFTIHGKYSDDESSQLDLMMAEPERWVNVYYSKAQDNVWASQFYESESEAKEHIISTSSYQTTIKINP